VAFLRVRGVGTGPLRLQFPIAADSRTNLLQE